MGKKVDAVSPAALTTRQILMMKDLRRYQDLLRALLDKDASYTEAEARKILTDELKRKVGG
jgi:hypothetical protein